MHRKRIIVGLATVLTVGTVVWLSRREDPDLRNLDALSRVESRRTLADRDSEKGLDFDWFVARGRGQPVPDDLIVDPDPGGFWFVGKTKGGVGVEIPFAPGHLPKPPPALEPVNENPGFLGAEACQPCHEQKYESFRHTAHHRTSSLATVDSIAGSFKPGENQMLTRSPDVRFTMIQRDREFYQRVSFYDWNFEVPFHIVTGSSKMAQTFLYWHSDGLYEMNVTHLTSLDDWINSPGYIDGDAAYARPIGRRCIECHTTYADFRGPPNHFTPGSIIFGVSCERCHGPGRDHVEYHQTHRDDPIARHIVLSGELSRKQQLNICSQCHSGIVRLKGKPYQFRPGDDLEDHYHLPDGEAGNGVHTTNQLARLSQSECFIQSEMSCVDCHDPHQLERSQMKLFSQRCLNCHQGDQCGMAAEMGDRLSDNCVDCHMPRRTGDHLRLNTAAGTVFPSLRDHYIRVDSLATEEYLKTLSLVE